MEVCWNARGDSFKEILDRMLKIRWYYGVLGIFLRKVQLSDDGWIRLMYSNILNIVREKKPISPISFRVIPESPFRSH